MPRIQFRKRPKADPKPESIASGITAGRKLKLLTLDLIANQWMPSACVATETLGIGHLQRQPDISSDRLQRLIADQLSTEASRFVDQLDLAEAQDLCRALLEYELFQRVSLIERNARSEAAKGK